MKLGMQKFKLSIGMITSHLESWSCFMDEWIGLALENQVKELHLDVGIPKNILYPLPETVFLAKSITDLSLWGFKLDHPQVNNAFRFQSLRKLELCLVRLDELMIQKLTSDSPMLEEIFLKYCWGFAYCHVPKLQRLRIFEMNTSFSNLDLKSIEITAPNLDKCNLEFDGEVIPLE
ncbi:hypothetical protein PTKIN_Ptkin18bG0057400 [Pterospermum kingtungense]